MPGALVETKSIDANSAVHFGEMLLDSNVLGSSAYYGGLANPSAEDRLPKSWGRQCLRVCRRC